MALPTLDLVEGRSGVAPAPTALHRHAHSAKGFPMVKKLKKMADSKAASPAGLLDSQLAGAVKASAQQIWLAGMGAFAKAQEEGGKVFEEIGRAHV